MATATENNLQILNVTPDDTRTLTDVLRTFWPNISLNNMQFAEHGKGGATVVILPHHVAKIFRDHRDDKPWRVEAFDREHAILNGLTNEVKKRDCSARNLLGVDAPILANPSDPDHGNALFVMSRVEGHPLWNLPDLAHQDWLMDTLAKFYVGFDKVGASQIPNARENNPYLT